MMQIIELNVMPYIKTNSPVYPGTPNSWNKRVAWYLKITIGTVILQPGFSEATDITFWVQECTQRTSSILGAKDIVFVRNRLTPNSLLLDDLLMI
jgi:hypothetical protein